MRKRDKKTGRFIRESAATAEPTAIHEEAAPGSGILVESGTAGEPSTVWIDMITPGWGSSGYYSEEVLQRDLPKVYPSGSHMYLDHPTMTEMHERPERSVKDLAAVTLETAHWNAERGSMGAKAKLFPDHREAILAKADAIGVSIFADGDVEESDREVDGKSGPIVHEISEGFSVDFVTLPGRGGKIGDLLESAREEIRKGKSRRTHITELRETLKESGASEEEVNAIVKPIEDFMSKESRPSDGGKEVNVDELERVQQQLSEAETRASTAEQERDTAIQERDEARTERDRAQDAILLAEAHRVAAAAVSEVDGLPERAVERAVSQALREDLPLDGDGKLIKETLNERAKTAAESEIEYLTESGASREGRVTGLGTGVSGGGEGTNGNGGGSNVTEADRTRLESSLQRLGLSEDQAKIAAEGR